MAWIQIKGCVWTCCFFLNQNWGLLQLLAQEYKNVPLFLWLCTLPVGTPGCRSTEIDPSLFLSVHRVSGKTRHSEQEGPPPAYWS